MILLIQFIARVYALLLRLYPRKFRDEFGVEMQATFAEAISEMTHCGFIAVAWLCLRELRELPANLALEHWTLFQKGSITMNTTSAFDDRPLSWLETVIGLVPFLLFGPVSTWLAYPYPYPAESLSGWFDSNWSMLAVLFFFIGIVIGWRNGWKRWSFSYLGLGVLLLSVGLVKQIYRWVHVIGVRRELSRVEEFLINVVPFAVILILIFTLTRIWRSPRLFYSTIRKDWTQVSFGLYILAATVYCGIDHETVPNPTILVALPGVIISLSALAYLHSRNKSQRFWSLFLGLTLTTGVCILNQGFPIFYGIMLITIVFLPALLEFLPPQKKTVMTE